MTKAQAIKLANEYNLGSLLVVDSPHIWLFVAKGYKGKWAVEKYIMNSYTWRLASTISELPNASTTTP